MTEPSVSLVRAPSRSLTVASAGTLLVLMIYTAPLITLPDTAAGVHAGLTAQTWLLSSISVGLAALLLVAGSLADDRGRKRVFVGGAALLTVGTVAAASAGSAPVFIAARVVQGAASAAVIAASLGLIAHAFPEPAARARATGVWGSMLGAGVALGPLLFAGLAHLAGWRTGYWAAAVAAAVLTATAVPLLDESRTDQPRRLDIPGSLALGAGLAFLVAAVTEARSGWLRPTVAVLLLVAAVLLVAFVVIEGVRREPMLDLALFRRPDFVIATGGALFTGVSVVGMMSYLPTVLERNLGQTPLQAAVLFTLWSGTSFVASLQVRRLAGRVAGRYQLALGLVLCAVSYLSMLGFTSWHRLVPGLLVSGIGYGVLNAGLARLAVESVPPGRGGMGSGANNTARYVGSSVGIALAVAIITAQGVNAALAVSAGIALAGALAAVTVRAEL